MLLLFLVISFLTTTGSQKYTQSDCGRDFVTSKPPNERIHNGIQLSADDHRFPWLVSLQFNVSNPAFPGSGKYMKHYCGASIIEPDILITAAHCSPYVAIRQGKMGQEILEEPVRVVAGSRYWDVPVSRAHGFGNQLRSVNASDFITHPDYNYKTNMLDIALIKLNEPFQMTDRVRSICLPAADAKFQGLATIAGWGDTDTTPNGRDVQYLRTAVVSLLPSNWCFNYKERFRSEFNHCVGFRTRHGFRQTCHGDSGGPMMIKMNDRSFLIGIVSGGIKSCTGLNPSVQAKVSAVKKWISETITDIRSRYTLFHP